MSLAPWFLRAVMIATVVIAFIAGARLALARVRAVRKASAERERFAARAARHQHPEVPHRG
ncbi:hypothetical protein [Gemmatimonas sp.]|jgi:hypothetical protein|uniref:hypothetical protein n=1 Tax=Gemmatimonas sp. TaxID=1962908 RepID=UPI0037BEADBE